MKRKKNSLSHLESYLYEFYVREGKSFDELIDGWTKDLDKEPKPKRQVFTEEQLFNVFRKMLVLYLTIQKNKGIKSLDVDTLLEEFKESEDE